jgi:hypothetical protein
VKTYRQRYFRRWKDDESSFDAILSNDLFEQRWDRPADLPAVPATIRLADGLACAYAGDHARAYLLFERAIKFANRLEAEDRFCNTEVAEAGHPHDLAEVVRARALAHWILGELLNRADLRKAAELFVTWCLTKAEDRRRFNDSVTMNVYLQGVRCAFMANDLDYARDLLATKHKLQWHHGNERKLWTRLVSAFPKIDAQLRDDIEGFFDRVRDPDFKEVLDGLPTFVNREALALDTGIIRQMYLLNASPLDSVEPLTVINAVAY